MDINIVALTDKGLVRENNEDSYFIHGSLPLGCVCDGLGGHASGELASAIIVDVFQTYDILSDGIETAFSNYCSNVAMNKEENNFVNLARLANMRVYEHSISNMSFDGMGSTLVALYISQAQKDVCFVNVGDSRAYYINKSMIRQITVDHSYVEEQRRKKGMGRNMLKDSSLGHVITRAIGASEDVQIDFFKEPLQEGFYLLCSDGLTGVLSDKEIHQNVLAFAHDSNKVVANLIEKVKSCGAPDNVTIVLFRVKKSVVA